MASDELIVKLYPLVTARILKLRELADALGISTTALRNRAYKIGAQGQVVDQATLIARFKEDGETPTEYVLRVAADRLDAEAAAGTHKPERRWEYVRGEDGKITHVLTFLANRILKVSIDAHASMRWAYSKWDGKPDTINQVAKRSGLTRREFVNYKTIHGWTHDDDPYLDHIIEDTPIEVLTNNLIQEKRRALELDFSRQQERADRSDAEKWRNLQAGVWEPFKHLATHIEMVKMPLLWDKPIDPLLPSGAKTINQLFSPHKLIINACDWQIGEKAAAIELTKGGDYNTQIAADVIGRYAEKIVAYVANQHGEYDEIIIADLGDLGHGLEGCTAHGTPLEVDSVRQEQVHVILNLMRSLVDCARQLAPKVTLLHVECNHLGFGGTLIFDQLAYWYAGENPVEGVTVRHNYEPVEYLAIDPDILLVFFHGKTAGPANKAIARAGPTRERDAYWLINEGVRKHPKHRNVYLITGHFHHRIHEEFSDFNILQLGSPSLGDRYADDLRVSGPRPTQTILEIDPAQGLVYPIPIPLD